MNSKKLTLNLIIGFVLMNLTIFVSHTKAVENGKIVFESNGEIATMNADGSGRQSLNAFGTLPVFSPNGSKIAFFHQAGAIYVMNANGSNQTFVTSASNETNQLYIRPLAK